MNMSAAAGILCALLAFVPLPTTAHAANPQGTGSHRWTLSTADTAMTIGVDAENHLSIDRLSGPSGWNWTREHSIFPLVSRADVAGVPHTLHWNYRSGSKDSRDGKVTIVFTNADPALELTSTWQARPGPGPIRHTMSIANRSANPVTIYEQESMNVHLAGPASPASVTYINDDGSIPDATGIYHDKLVAGYRKLLPISEKQDFIPYAVVDANGTEGIYIGWEWSVGRLAIAANHAPAGVSFKAGNSDDFKTDLAPGATFAVPPAFIGAYRGDLDDAANSLHKYLYNYSMPATIRKDASYPKVEWNAFAATGQGQGSWKPTEKKYYPLIDEIAPLGFEAVVLDVGWWQGDTKHRPDPPVGDAKYWPSGMLAARDYAHKHGMRFGLYWNGNPSMTTVAGIERREKEAKYLYSKFKIDFYRSDGTDGNVLQTGGYGKGSRAHYPEDQGYWQTKGFYQFLDTMYAEVPNFAYENCSGGGRIKDYGIVKRSFTIQDQDIYHPLDARRAFYDSSYAMHPMQLATLVGSWAAWQASGSVYEFRSASLGAAYWHPDAPNGGNGGPVWSDSQKAEIKKAVTTYKTMIRPLVRTANLYHIFPRPDGKRWDGIEYFDPATKKGAAIIFRPDSAEEHQAIPFQGLASTHQYWVWSEDDSFAPVRKSGADLMRSQLGLHLAKRDSSDILFFQDAALGKPVHSAQ